MKTEQVSITKLISRNLYDTHGNQISNPEKNIGDLKLSAYLNDKYYTDELNRNFGVAELVALFQMAAGGALWWSSPSPATAINEVTTIGDYIQVLTVRTNIFGPRDKEETRTRRSGATAWLQVLAGLGGIASIISHKIMTEDNETKDMSLIQKVGLSTSSFISAMFMFFGAGEKSALATTTQKNENSKTSQTIRMDSNSDARGFFEELGMVFVPWFSKFKPFKMILDYSMIYAALRDGIAHFIHDGVSMVFNNKVFHLDSKLKKVLQAFFLIPGNGKNNGTVMWPFNKKWFLGTENDKNKGGVTEPGAMGFRSKHLLPTLRAFGCDPPVYYLNGDKNLISEYYESKNINMDVPKGEHPDKELVSIPIVSRNGNYSGNGNGFHSKNGTHSNNGYHLHNGTSMPLSTKSKVL